MPKAGSQLAIAPTGGLEATFFGMGTPITHELIHPGTYIAEGAEKGFTRYVRHDYGPDRGDVSPAHARRPPEGVINPPKAVNDDLGVDPVAGDGLWPRATAPPFRLKRE
ncbi:MAG: hypothetical protein WCB19_09450 [Thermoplasmata archaeon]